MMSSSLVSYILYLAVYISIAPFVLCNPCPFWTSSYYYNGTCYKVNQVKKTWNESEINCTQDVVPAKLAEPIIPSHLDFLKNINKNTRQDWWLGGVAINSLEGRWITTKENFSIISSISTSGCVKLASINPYLTNSKCDLLNIFVCEYYVGDPCVEKLPGADYYGGQCYKIYNNEVHWIEAKNICTEAQSILAEFYNEESYNFVKDIAERLSISVPPVTSDIFLGGNDSNHEGIFTWMSTDQIVTLTDWASGEPNNYDKYKGEDQLGIRWYSNNNKYALNDLNGTLLTARPLCQRDVLSATYLIPLPESDSSDIRQPKVHVSTVSEDVVYLYFHQHARGMTPSMVSDWVTSFRSTVYLMNKNNEMTDTGMFSRLLMLKCTRHLSVVLFQTSTNNHTGTTLVYPIDYFTSGYFILTLANNSTGNHLTVTAWQDETEVIIKFPRSLSSPVAITFNGITFQQVKMSRFSLASLDSVQCQSLDDFSGTFVYSNKPVVVLSGTKSSQLKSGLMSYDNTLEMALGVDTLSYRYVSPYPSVLDTYKFVALYDATSIKITQSTHPNVFLSRAGDVSTIYLNSSNFLVMESDVDHPFYVIKMTSGFTGSCVMSLVPETLWLNELSIYVPLDRQPFYVVMETKATDKFMVDNGTTSTNCNPILGTQYSGCTLSLSQGTHAFKLHETNSTMTAYTSSPSASIMSFCHSLGYSSHVSNSQFRFPSEEYLLLKEGEPFQPPSLHNFTFYDVTTSSDTDVTTDHLMSSAATATAQTIPPKLSTSNPTGITSVPETTNTTSNLTTQSSTTLDVTLNTSSNMTTEYAFNFTSTSSTLTSNATLNLSSTTDPASHSSAAVDNLTTVSTPYECRFTHSRNLSHEDLLRLLNSIQTDLLIDKFGIFAYRRRKMSIWDGRISSTAIGVSGVIIMTCFVGFLLSPDILRILKYTVLKMNINK